MQRRAWLAVLALAACRDRTDASGSASDAGTADVEDATPRPTRPDVHPDAAVALPLDRACEGMRLALIGALLDERCAVPDDVWVGLTEAPGLTQEAKVDGDRVVFALTNRGPKAIDVPLRFDDRHPERAFSAVAETDGGLFVLAGPSFDLAPADAAMHVHSARIRLPPAGTATVSLAIDYGVRERIDRRDASAPKRVEAPLLLHIGQLVCPLDAGDPAKVLR